MLKHITSLFIYGWDGWIRTIGMTESKSVALPLGDIPKYISIILWGGRSDSNRWPPEPQSGALSN